MRNISFELRNRTICHWETWLLILRRSASRLIAIASNLQISPKINCESLLLPGAVSRNSRCMDAASNKRSYCRGSHVCWWQGYIFRQIRISRLSQGDEYITMRRISAIFDGENPRVRRESDKANAIRRDEKQTNLRDMQEKTRIETLDAEGYFECSFRPRN